MGHLLSTYHDALAFLFERTTGGNKFGLERTEALLHELGDPHRSLRVYHVAGTNGKGSVCATLEALLRARGQRVAKYTSPHLVDFRERMVVNGDPVESAFVVDFIERRVAAVERTGATFFEATTAMAFDWFAHVGADVAVVETGLGGRLDSTNVVLPVVAGVTSIAIDHVEYLGNTREEIAVEKAGIFKPGAVAIIGEQDVQVAALLARLATECGASAVVDVWQALEPRGIGVDGHGTRFTVTLDGVAHVFHTPLAGAHQAANAATAIAMVESGEPPQGSSPALIQQGLDAVRLPGRFQQVGPWIFDVAHNPAGASVLAGTLAAVTPARPVMAVLCVLADKDWRGIMRALAPQVDEFIMTDAPTAPASRTWHVDEALEYASASGWSAHREHDFDRALELARSRGATVLITGSFHTVGDAMARLQVDPLAR